METRVIHIDSKNPDARKIQEAARLIDTGGLVAFPTETVYGIACRVNNESLRKLDNLKARGPGKYYTLHIGQKTQVCKYVPSPGLKAQKLIRKSWPGPVTIVFELSQAEIDKQRAELEEEVFHNLYKDNTIGIRCPDNRIASLLLSEVKNSVVAPSANITESSPAVDAEGVLACFSGRIEMVLDGGVSKYRKNSTVVKVKGSDVQILREGVYSSQDVKAFLEVKFLLVCTGNTCRSPMAEGMFRKYLAEKLGCAVDELAKKGYKVSSAGILNIAGSPASAESVVACRAKGIDISAHRSRVITREIAADSDVIFAMGREHGERITALEPEAANRCMLLAESRNIPDPIGQSQEVYDKCAELIEEAVLKRIGEIKI
ncbi:L-threonylcarbamoyladenylate synthase [Planctomycetota bacterium]